MNTVNLEDTIVAISTAPGVGATGVVRMSGRAALNYAQKICSIRDLGKRPSHTVHFGTIRGVDGAIIDEVVVTIFRNPKSYTGEDVVEISGHGSPLILSQILQACQDAGARLAMPGEFTQRAFLNGKMDLTQVEAVGDLIAAKSMAAKNAALNHLRGGFSKDLNDLRERMIHFSAMIELELDFGEEDVEFADRNDFKEYLGSIRQKTQQLIDSFRLGNVIKHGVSVAIIGRPNAGKSTLLNALLNEDRAIVSDIAGTTRDTIEESLNIDGIQFRLIDTAGIREHTPDIIEAMGIERSKDNAARADIILYVRDLNDADTHIDWVESYSHKTIPVWTKLDLYQSSEGKPFEQDAHAVYLYPEAKESAIQRLRHLLYTHVTDASLNTEDTIVTNARHHEALKKIAASLEDIEKGLQHGFTGDLIALDIRNCLYHLGEITGRVDVDRDILGKIFSSFCIGK